jgi:hypothetical protein
VKLRLARPQGFSGAMASIYTVVDDDTKFNPFSEFLSQCDPEYEDKALDFITRLKSIGNITGATENFFKHREGTLGDGVCALYDEPAREMRLFCIRISDKILIVGGGGPKDVRAWQNNPVLKKAAELMIYVSALIKEKLDSGSLTFSGDELFFRGNLQLI